MKPKLLFLVTSSAWGGAERYVARLAAEAVADYEVIVAAGASKGHQLFKALPPAVTHIELPALKHRVAPLSDLKAILAVRRLIDRESVDLVHCNSSKAGLIGALAARLSRRRPRVVYTAHGWGFLERRALPFRLMVLWSEKLAARFRDATIVLSETEKGVALRERLSAQTRLHLIPHGLDRAEIAFLPRDDARRALAPDAGASDFLFYAIANAFPSKALPLLIEAFGDAGLADARLIIAGDGPLMSDVRAARERSAARDRILLLGAVADAARLLSGADAFVLASLKEGLPWTVLEAAAAGLPMILSRVGAIPELVTDGESALLVPPGDAAALARALRRAHDEPELRARLGRGASDVSARHGARAMLDATFALYRTLLRSRP